MRKMSGGYAALIDSRVAMDCSFPVFDHRADPFIATSGTHSRDQGRLLNRPCQQLRLAWYTSHNKHTSRSQEIVMNSYIDKTAYLSSAIQSKAPGQGDLDLSAVVITCSRTA